MWEVFLEMMKKFWILMLSLSILFVVPANAVQIGPEEYLFNLNNNNEFKTSEINDLLNNNETVDINATLTNETNVLNGTVGNSTNGTFVNGTLLNNTVGNYTNETFVNGTGVLNDTVGNNTNGTSKSEKNDLKENIIGTLTNVALITGVISGALMTVGSILISIPDPTLVTKIATVSCVIGAAVTGAVTVGCGVACIFIYWLM